MRARTDRVATPAPQRAGEVLARRTPVQQVLALQRGAGNRAVGRLLQRSPQTWAAANETAAVLALAKGGGKKPYWPEIKRLTAYYGTLQAHDVATRGQVLGLLATEMKAWRDHQAETFTFVVKKELAESKKRALTALDRLILAERAELLQAQQQPAPPPQQAPPRLIPQPPAPVASLPASTSTSPIGSFADEIFGFDEELPDETESASGEKEEKKEKTEEETEPIVQPRPQNAQVPPARAQGRLKIRVHMTQQENLAGPEGIHESGLVRGKKQGIGLPETGKPDPKNLYTLDLTSKDTTRYVSSEAGGEPVVVVTIEEGFQDGYYAESGFGAQLYSADAPPVRGVPPGPPVVGTPPNTELWSFTLPMTPRSRQGLTHFINRYAGVTVSEQEAVGIVHTALHKGMPAYIQGKFPPTQQ